MKITVDNQVFKLQDSRISALAAGRYPAQQLVHMISPGDWLIFYNGTVYALTEEEYYAAQRNQIQQTLTKEQFEQILQLPGDIFQEKDRKYLEGVKKHKNKCSKCQYNTYKSQVMKIAKKYPEATALFKPVDYKKDIKPYPATTGEIETKVSYVFPRFFNKVDYDRKPCLDCVQKHISYAHTQALLGKAYIKGCQVLQGYEEHKALAIANLQEAFEECPNDCKELKDLIMFCIGKSKKQNSLFIPLRNLLYMIQIARAETSQQEALDQNEPDDSFALELSPEMAQKLYLLPASIKAKALTILRQPVTGDTQKTRFQGYLASLADLLVEFCPDVSNMIRNRRLMFRACPELIEDTPYSLKDIERALIHPTKVQEQDCSDSGSTVSA